MTHVNPSIPSPRADALADALGALEALLERRARELSDDVAYYPTPIANCDDQLPKLIEQRTEALARLRAVAAITSNDAAACVDDVRRMVASYGRADDAEETALLARLQAIASACGPSQAPSMPHVDETASRSTSPDAGTA